MRLYLAVYQQDDFEGCGRILMKLFGDVGLATAD